MGKLVHALISAAVVALIAVVPTAGRSGDPLVDQIDAVEWAAPVALNRHATPGAVVAIVQDGLAAWSGGFGVMDVRTGDPVTPSTVFPAASVTKPVTAWAILKLADEGRIDLDAPIMNYLARWRLPPSEFDADAVTARRILAHAAGLSFGGDPGVEPGQPVPTLEDAAEGVGQEGGPLRLDYPSGAAYRYSSKGYILLELAVEEITGEPFDLYVTREILAPLGMRASGFDPSVYSDRAAGHDWYGRALPDFALATKAQGGLWTTAGDMALFLAAAMSGSGGEPPGRGVISPNAVAASLAPYPFTEDTSEVGLGYNLSRSGGTLVARKGGDRRGYKAMVFSVPEQGAGIVILANSDRAAAGVFADIACSWSAAVSDDPLAALCSQMFMLRNAHFGVAGFLSAVALAMAISAFRALGSGTRSFEWPPSRGRAVTLGLLVLVGALWWGFWYSDIPLRLLGYPPTFYTVRFDPWPTALIWVSYGISLLLAVLMFRVLTPKVPSLSSSAR